MVCLSGLAAVVGGHPLAMTNSSIRAVLDDGPRTGEVVGLDPGPDGGPPAQVVVSDPRGMGGRPEESFDVEATPIAATTYHLHEPGPQDNTYIYRTGEPD
jgi:hypothetical protein